MIVHLRIKFSIVTSNKEMRKKSEEPKYETSHHPNLTIIKPHTEEQGERERESEWERRWKGEISTRTQRDPSLSYLIKKQNERIERRYSNMKISNAPIWLWGNILPYFKSMAATSTGNSRKRNCLINQVDHNTPLLTPFILRVSRSLDSFSNTSS